MSGIDQLIAIDATSQYLGDFLDRMKNNGRLPEENKQAARELAEKVVIWAYEQPADSQIFPDCGAQTYNRTMVAEAIVEAYKAAN